MFGEENVTEFDDLESPHPVSRSGAATWSRAASTGSDTSAQWPPRYPKRVAYYRSEIVIAAIVLWLRADLQDVA
jgi:hypothetical protein